LFENSANGYLKLGKVLIQWGSVSVPKSQYTLVYPIAYKQIPTITISTWSSNGTVVHSGRSQTQCPFFSSTSTMGFDWMTVGVV